MEFLDVPLYSDDIFKMLVRFAIDLVFLTLMVVLAIAPTQRNREFTFTAVMMNVAVFFICFSLKKLDLGTGMALGLFAIFGVLRYRTDSIGIKDMAYLFIVIGIAVINSLSNTKTSYLEVLAINVLILGSAMLKERILRNHLEIEQTLTDSTPNGTNGNGKKEAKEKKLPKYQISYDKVKSLGLQYREQLIADLCNRTGLNVFRVEVERIDLVQNNSLLTVWVDDRNA